jgi:hypothetical protein
MFKNVLLLVLIAFFAPKTSVFSQTPTPKQSSLFIEFGYLDIPGEDLFGQMMFAKKSMTVYVDTAFVAISSFTKNPAPNTMDVVKIDFIKDLKTGKIYSCATIEKEKYKEIEPNDSKMAAMFDMYADTIYSLNKINAPTETVQNIVCEKWQLAQTDMVSPFIYLTKDVANVELMKNVPLAVFRKGEFVGISLGHDVEAAGNIYKLRAQTIEFDKPQAIAKLLATFKDVKKDEINQAIKKMMGF